jgi:hypothetical protein
MRRVSFLLAFTCMISACAVTQTQMSSPTATSTLLPSPSPTIAPTMDPLAEYEHCRKLAYAGVSYTVFINSGEVTKVSINYRDDAGQTIDGEFDLPFCVHFKGFSSGDSLFVSAEIILPEEAAGIIKCVILRAGGADAADLAEGYGSIATCSSSVP